MVVIFKTFTLEEQLLSKSDQIKNMFGIKNVKRITQIRIPKSLFRSWRGDSLMQTGKLLCKFPLFCIEALERYWPWRTMELVSNYTAFKATGKRISRAPVFPGGIINIFLRIWNGNGITLLGLLPNSVCFSHSTFRH